MPKVFLGNYKIWKLFKNYKNLKIKNSLSRFEILDLIFEI